MLQRHGGLRPADSAVCLFVWWLCCSSETQSGASNTISSELRPDSSRPIKAVLWAQVKTRSVITAAAETQQLFSERWQRYSAVSPLSAAGWRLTLACIYPAPSTNPLLRVKHVCKGFGYQWPPVLQRKSSWIRQDYSAAARTLQSARRDSADVIAGEKKNFFHSASILHLCICFQLKPESIMALNKVICRGSHFSS